MTLTSSSKMSSNKDDSPEFAFEMECEDATVDDTTEDVTVKEDVDSDSEILDSNEQYVEMHNPDTCTHQMGSSDEKIHILDNATSGTFEDPGYMRAGSENRTVYLVPHSMQQVVPVLQSGAKIAKGKKWMTKNKTNTASDAKTNSSASKPDTIATVTKPDGDVKVKVDHYSTRCTPFPALLSGSKDSSEQNKTVFAVPTSTPDNFTIRRVRKDDDDECEPVKKSKKSRKSLTNQEVTNAHALTRENIVSNPTIVHMSGIPYEYLVHPEKCRNYKNYSEDDVNKALDYMRETKVSAKKTSSVFGIPPSTLYNKLNKQGRELATCKGIVKKETDAGFLDLTDALPHTEEMKILEYVTLMHRYGYHLSKGDIIQFAKLLVKALPEQRNNKCLFRKSASESWYNSFRDRDPALKYLTSFGPKFTSQNVRHYFEDLREIVDRHKLQDSPELIYKIDEIGLDIDNHPETRPAHLKTIPNTAMYGVPNASPVMRLLGCGNALGVALPPFFVGEGHVSFTESHAIKGPPGTAGISKYVQKSGSISLMRTYIQKHFTRYVQMGNSRKGVLLLYNGNSSMLSIDDIKWARERQIYLYVLPPHGYSTHKPVDPIDPFDMGLFAHFHFYAAEESRDFTGGYLTKTIDLKDISYIAGKAYHRCLSWEKLADGFKKSGVYPLSPQSYISALNNNMQIELQDFVLPPFGSQPQDVCSTEKQSVVQEVKQEIV